jgi:hypothetical protein
MCASSYLINSIHLSADLKGIDFRNVFDYVRYRTDPDLACLFNRACLNLGLRYEEGS